MTLAEINYMEQQLFQVAPLPLYEAQHYPYGFDMQIKCPGGDGRGASQTNWLKITPEQMQKIERVLLGGCMSERLEELMYASGLTASGCWDQMDDYDRKAIERLAKLIVLECVEVAIDNGCGDFVDIEDMILERFDMSAMQTKEKNI